MSRLSQGALVVGMVSALATLALGSVFAQSSVYEKLTLMLDVLKLVEDNYVDPIGEGVLLQGAVEGLLFTVDPDSVYVPPGGEPILEVDRLGRGEAPTTGIVLGGRRSEEHETWEIAVVGTLPASPAARADVQPGDRVIKVGDVFIAGMSVENVYERLRAPTGQKVSVSFYRPSSGEIFDVEIENEVLPALPPVAARRLDGDVGYLKFWRLDDDAVASARSSLDDWGALTATESASDRPRSGPETGFGPLRGLVVDLREAMLGPGEAGVALADLLLPDGRPVARVVDREGREIRPLVTADGRRVRPDLPVEVLVGGRTVGAGEVAAALLKEFAADAGTELLGERTFGRAIVQRRATIEGGGTVILTAGTFQTVGGLTINGVGVEPDQKLAPSPDDGAADGHGEAAAAGGDSEADRLLNLALERLGSRSRVPAGG